MIYFEWDRGRYGNKFLEEIVVGLTRDIPGFMHLHEFVWLAKFAMGRVVLEIGSYKGQSTRAMLPFAKCIYCVDHFHPGPIGQGHIPDSPGIRAEFEENIAPWASKVTIYEMFSQDALSRIWPPIGLLLIDGDHNYESVKNDIEFTRFLMPGGIVALHDAEKPEVAQALLDSGLPKQWLELEPAETLRAFVNVGLEGLGEWAK